MNKEELIGKLQMVYVGDKNALNELIGYCDGLKEVIEIVQQENKKYKEVIDKAIEHINKYESIKAYYEYIDEDGYDEYNYDEDFKKELLDLLKEVKL